MPVSDEAELSTVAKNCLKNTAAKTEVDQCKRNNGPLYPTIEERKSETVSKVFPRSSIGKVAAFNSPSSRG